MPFHSVQAINLFDVWLKLRGKSRPPCRQIPLYLQMPNVESSCNEALDSVCFYMFHVNDVSSWSPQVRLAETFLGIADSLQKTRGALIAWACLIPVIPDLTICLHGWKRISGHYLITINNNVTCYIFWCFWDIINKDSSAKTELVSIPLWDKEHRINSIMPIAQEGPWYHIRKPLISQQKPLCHSSRVSFHRWI